MLFTKQIFGLILVQEQFIESWLVMGFLDKAKQLAEAAKAATAQPVGRDITLVFGPSLMAGYQDIIANKGKINSEVLTFHLY